MIVELLGARDGKLVRANWVLVSHEGVRAMHHGLPARNCGFRILGV